MRSVYQSPCDPCKYNYTSVNEFGECEEDVCNCPKDKKHEECWLEQWAREIKSENA